MSKRRYYVYRTRNGNPPTFVHSSYDSAKAEAVRLAVKHPNEEFQVLRIETVITAKLAVVVRKDGYNIDDDKVISARKAGGDARALSLTPERRSEIARKAAQARWAKNTDSA